MVQGNAAVGFFAEPGRHGRLHRELWWKMGKPCPVAVVLGCDPLLFIVSSLSFPAGTSDDMPAESKGNLLKLSKTKPAVCPFPQAPSAYFSATAAKATHFRKDHSVNGQVITAAGEVLNP
jgi:hypothetical protein